MNIRKATHADVGYLVTRLRPEDVEEIRLAGRPSPRTVLECGFFLSTPHAFSICVPGTERPYAMCGVSAADTDKYGVVWLLGTPEISNHALSFQRAVKFLLKKLWASGRYQHIGNAICGDSRTVAWITALGAKFYHITALGPEQKLFFLFKMSAPDAVIEEQPCVT